MCRSNTERSRLVFEAAVNDGVHGDRVAADATSLLHGAANAGQQRDDSERADIEEDAEETFEG